MKQRSFYQVNPLSPFKVDSSNDSAIYELADNLYKRMANYGYISDIVIFCIGTDRSTGDALGPLVGTKLKKLYLPNIHVYGTLDEPIHAVNLQQAIEKVREAHPYSPIIAIDACLGKLNSVGKINVAHGPLKPGAGVKKELPEVGDFNITGIVNIGGFMEYFVLQNTRLSIVMKLSDMIAQSIYLSANRFFKHNSKPSTAFS